MNNRSSFSTLARTGAVAAVAALVLAAGPSEPDPILNHDPVPIPSKMMATGTVEIDGQAHDFEVLECAFGHEETGDPLVTFFLHGGNEETGLTVDVSRADMSEAGLGYRDTVHFLVGDPLDPDEALEATWQGDAAGAEGASEFLSFEEKKVAAENLTFVGTAGPQTGSEKRGSIRATCP